ncbi:uncharacterized protein BXZ73DRAFT_104509 [Epithele typhae]|uniref:uncharacterized protein n=1 Tax=Epithele typhae TaxID=378194 RepID=UPI002007D43F|nr:uncharacterized protein BXZ73DRAFT_104509 [Epithele typhae]KAH9921220.1 hypothetical protein BXZ73DRAFT_104509 [Epithele typhae]
MVADKNPALPGVSNPARAQGSSWFARDLARALARSAGDPSATPASTEPGSSGIQASSHTVSSGTHIVGFPHAAEDAASRVEPTPSASQKTSAGKGKARAVEFTPEPDSDDAGSNGDAHGLEDLDQPPSPDAQDSDYDSEFPEEFKALKKEKYTSAEARRLLREATAQEAEREAARELRRKERKDKREAEEAAREAERKRERAERQRKEAEETRARNVEDILSSAVKRKRSAVESGKARIKRTKRTLGKIGKAAAKRLSRSPSRSSASHSENEDEREESDGKEDNDDIVVREADDAEDIFTLNRAPIDSRLITMFRNGHYIPLTALTNESLRAIRSDGSKRKLVKAEPLQGEKKHHILEVSVFPDERTMSAPDWEEAWKNTLEGLMPGVCEEAIIARWRAHVDYIKNEIDYKTSFPALRQFDLDLRHAWFTQGPGKKSRFDVGGPTYVKTMMLARHQWATSQAQASGSGSSSGRPNRNARGGRGPGGGYADSGNNHGGNADAAGGSSGGGGGRDNGQSFPSGRRFNGRGLFCLICNKPGHKADRCRTKRNPSC